MQSLTKGCGFHGQGQAGIRGPEAQGLGMMLDSRQKPENVVCCWAKVLEKMAAKAQKSESRKLQKTDSPPERWCLGRLFLLERLFGMFFPSLDLSSSTDQANAPCGFSCDS